MKNVFFRIAHPRKTHIYGVGTGKSGTHTLAEIWGNQYRTAHEPESELMLEIYLKWKSGSVDDKIIIDFILQQDKRLWLEINSSAVNYLFLDFLQDIFPKSKYILTIRNPYAWLDSFFNHQLSQSCSANWQTLRELRFRPDLNFHPNEEQVLKEHSLYTLDGYLSYWNEHNSKVIACIPANRLLVLPTDKINQNLNELARFANLKNSVGMNSNCHSFSAQRKWNLLQKINQEYLDYKVKEHCQGLMDLYFPEIHSYTDAFFK